MTSEAKRQGAYRSDECKKCGRFRVLRNGVCDKCDWDNDNNNWSSITRSEDVDEDRNASETGLVERMLRRGGRDD